MAEADDGLRDEEVLGQAAVLVVAQRDAPGAAVALADAAEAAGTAGDDRAERDVVADFDVVNAVADLRDDAGDLVAGNDALLGVLLALEDADV